MEWTCNPPAREDLIHPDEKNAALEIQKSQLFAYVAQYCGDIMANIVSKPDMMLTGYPVSEQSAPRIYRCYKKALSRLGCQEEYPLFVDFGYELWGKVYGSEENGHIIIMNSACGEILTDGELTGFLGGEIGHILAGHPENQAILDNLDIITKRIPFAGELVRNHVLGLFAKWLIASGYTQDRAALFAAENIDAVISLRKKQMGRSAVKTEHILNQEQRDPPEHLGMYYVLLAKDLPILAGVSRIQEIVRWVGTKQFAQRYCSLLYKLCLNSREIPIPHDKVLLERHRMAMEGQHNEMILLGEQYLFGKEGLQQNAITGESFLRQAAFLGNARAMFLEGGCLELGIVDSYKRPSEAKVLYRAAASRGHVGAQLKELDRVRRELPAAVLMAAKEVNRSTQLKYWLSISGIQPDKKQLFNALNYFWAPMDEPVLAADFGVTDFGIIGIVITSGGIYGSLKPGKMPFHINWKKYQASPLVQMEDNGKQYLYSGGCPICLCGESIRGTISELLIQVKIKMDNAYSKK